MRHPFRLVLLVAFGALTWGLAAPESPGALASLGAIVGALIALRLRDAERLAALEARLDAADAVRQSGVAGGVAGDSGAPGDDVPVLAPPVLAPPALAASQASDKGARLGAARGPRPSPRAPSPPLLERLPPEARRAWDFVTGGNPIVRVGIVVVFVALGLGIRYAVDLGWLSVAVRLAGAAAVGLAMVGLGWRLRRGTPGFGLAVQGGGVAVLYLTVYAAYALYGLIPSLAAIVLMGILAVGCGVLAVTQDAPGLAVLGVAGGFAAPVLAGTAAGNHVLLLAYYALLNLGVLGVAWSKGWRSVAVVGFVSTFVTGWLWGGLTYRPEWYATVQPFLALSFAVYLALAVRFAVRSARVPERALAVDTTLVFGLPAATFVLQAGLVDGVIPYGRAWSAAVLAAVYLGGAGLLRRQEGVRLLTDAFLAVGLVFATLALPLAFQRVVVGAMWVLEGAGLVWVGARQGKAWMRWGGIALQATAAVVLFAEGVLSRGTFTAESLTGWIVAAGLALSAYVLGRPASPALGLAAPALPAEPEADPPSPPRPTLRARAASGERWAGRALLAFALFWWTVTATVHVLDLAPDRWVLAGLLGAAAASGALFLGVGRVLGWPGLTAASFGTVAAGWVLWLLALADGASLIESGRALGWLAVLAVAALALTVERDHRLRRPAFVGAVWLATAVVARSMGDGLAPAGGAWGLGTSGAVLAAALVLAVRLPARVASVAERGPAVAGLALAATVWIAVGWFNPGGAAPLPTLPVLNPISLPTVAALLALAVVRRGAPAATHRSWSLLVGGLGFGSLTAAVLRAVHAWGGVSWTPDALWESSAAQAGLAVAWTVLALVLAVVAVRRGSRPLWFFGAAVLALVVAKLFLVDLSQAQALVRIVAFLTVGALMLLIGYRAPLPPERAEPAG